MWNSTWTKGITNALEKTTEAISEAEKRAAKGITEALEKTGEAITQAATQARKPETPAGETQDKAEETGSESKETEKEETQEKGDKTFGLPRGIPGIPGNANGAKVMKNLQMGWSSVVESTKRTVEATKEAVESERHRLERNFLGNEKAFYKRDPRKELDTEALRDAEVIYITDRILTMSHPAVASKTNVAITAQRKLAAVGHLLHRRHDGRYLVWNLSEVEYEISILDDQVLTFSFPGSPSPPLGMLLKILVSMENWMKADKRNVAVVHCLTGKGRTSTVLAAFLCWMGEAGFQDMTQALEYIAHCKKMTVDELTIPSQRRYASYFKNMLDGVRPSQPPLLLKRIVMSEAPKFAKGPERHIATESAGEAATSTEDALMGCAPYLQIFKAGKLLYTTAATMHVQQGEEELPFVYINDGTVCFNVDQVIQGDILVRCRHLTFHKQRVSMFRAAFHTGYVPPNVLRLTKSHLDGACTDPRYSDDFFLDLIFEKVDTETATKHLADHAEADESHEDKDDAKEMGAVIKASTFDSMLQGESRFWDVIARRRQEQSGQKRDETVGPTVGRRRGDGKKKPQDGQAQDAKAKRDTGIAAFSIGNEFDFVPETTKSEAPAEKDTLMEALDALEEDEHDDVEEITFGSTVETSSEKASDVASEGAGSVSTQGADSKLGDQASATGDKEKDSAVQSSIGDASDDMDALLASAGDDFGDMNLDDFDVDDDLDDLEAMLNT